MEARMARKKRIEHHGIVQQFARRLRAVRKERGMSQQDLALKAMVTTSYVGKLERSGSAPGLDMVGRLAEALGVAPEKLITSTGREVAALPVFKHQIQRHVRNMLGRTDEQSLQAIAVVMGLLDNALARQ
jgi:transcriptional regulator with XRE-family HTH domain